MLAVAPTNLDWCCPVNWQHPRNRGLVFWGLGVGGVSSGPRLIDLTNPGPRGNHGVLTNMDLTTHGWQASSRPGTLGRELRFDGVSDYVECGNTINLTAAITVSFWIKISSGRGPVTKSTLGSVGGWGFDYGGFTAGQIEFLVANGSYRSIGTPAPSGWFHCLATFDGAAATKSRIYINGLEKSPTVFASGTVSAITPTADTLKFGYNTAAGYFNGLLDDIRIYNRALSATEVQGVYEEDQAGHPNTLRWARPKVYGFLGGGPFPHYLRRSNSLSGGMIGMGV